MTSPEAELGGLRAAQPVPWHERRFWLIQGIVLAIAVGHVTLELGGALLGWPPLYLIPVSTFLIPAIYASLTFGERGAALTVAWCCILSLPSIILLHSHAQQLGIAIQFTIMLILTMLVGRSVDAERRAHAETTGALRRLGESRAALRRYIQLAADAQEEERKRLAREIHDETIQELVVARASLEAGRTGPDDGRVQVAVESLDGIIAELRRMCHDLRPSILDDLGLPHALDALTHDLVQRTGIRVYLSCEGADGRVDPKTELILYRIAQEALHNVERHSGATQASVQLLVEPGAVTLSVADDGRGFAFGDDGRAHAGPGHLGLIGMDERARSLGGTLTIASSPGEGTRVEVRASLALRRGKHKY
jgi:signal transduction histidine kinase